MGIEELDSGPVNYEAIRRVTGYGRGRKSRYRTADLVAMSVDRDPFYRDAPGRLERGQWFADIWRRFGIGYGTHVRRIHYRIVSAAPRVLLWNGDEYLNTEQCWERLLDASLNARYNALIPRGAIEDHRNAAPYIPYVDPGQPASVTMAAPLYPWKVGGVYFSDLEPRFEITYPHGEQGYHLAIFCEKSTMDDILVPLCRTYGATLVTASGENSETQVEQMARRIVDDGRPARILYVSDFDPAGTTMPVSAARKLEFLLRDAVWEDCIVTPIALSREQVEAYNIPRTMIKESDLRKGGFEKQHGTGGAELDALEATQPGLLREIVEEALSPFFDEDLADRVLEQRAAFEAACWEARREALAPFAERRDDLRGRVETVRASIAPELAELDKEAKALGDEVLAAVRDAMPDPEDFPVPEAEEADEDCLPEPLYDGSRTYSEQLAVYKRFQGKDGAVDE
jgi:hypothetical protein